MSASITQLAANNASVFQNDGSLVQPARAGTESIPLPVGGRRYKRTRTRTRKHKQKRSRKTRSRR